MHLFMSVLNILASIVAFWQLFKWLVHRLDTRRIINHFAMPKVAIRQLNSHKWIFTLCVSDICDLLFVRTPETI